MTSIRTKFVIDDSIDKIIQNFQEEDTNIIYQKYKKSCVWNSVIINACGDIILKK